ncbi:MAG: RNHCP domain-containing protein [Candidatus Micrarchaeaceae archaeon]
MCYNCNFNVKGNGYTDHCPNCLYGKHVDINPGDRKNTCKGNLKPTSTLYKNGSIIIFYKCSKCNAIKKFKEAKEDNRELLEQLLISK